MNEADELRFAGLEKDMETLRSDIAGINRTLHGIDGIGGLIRKIDGFFTAWATREEDKKIYDSRMEAGQKKLQEEVKEIRERRIFWIIVITAVCTVIGTLLAVLTFESEKGHTLLEHLGPHSAISDSVLSETAPWR